VPGYTVISDVSQTLTKFLDDALSGLATAVVHDLVDPPNGSTATLTLFLYDVIEDPSARNRPRLRVPVQTAGRQLVTAKKPPVALLLRYMLTAWAGTPLTEHEIIGRVIQAFYDHATLSGHYLLNSLANSVEALHLTLQPIELDNRARVWEAIDKPYRLSVNDEVRVVHIDAEHSRSLPAVTEQLVQPALVEGAP
jgi:hypothetical protein